MNGDGVHDIAIGASYNSTREDDAGAVWIFFGPPSGSNGQADADATVYGEYSSERLCFSGGAGDLLGDGGEDFVTAGGGEVQIHSGPLSGDISRNDAAANLTGGWGALTGADMDDDGQPDLLVHNYNDRVYGFLGPISTGDHSYTENDFAITGASYEYLGMSADAGGDLDGDGITDLVLGGRSRSDRATGAGAFYAFFGPITGDLSTGGADLEVTTDDVEAGLGSSVVIVGDTDGDGQDDILAGEVNAPGPWVTGGGAAYLFAGGMTGSLEPADATAALVGETWSGAGYDVADAGDVDGDGFGDVTVGASGFTEGTTSGRIYVVLGPFAGNVDLASAYAILNGNTMLGYPLAGIGERDGSARGVLAGGPYWTSGGWSRGGAWYLDLGDL